MRTYIIFSTRSGNTLMAEDAVESAGAKAPAITMSTQHIIAGMEVLCQTTDAARCIRHLESAATERRRIAGVLITPPRLRVGAESSGQIQKAGRRCTNISASWRMVSLCGLIPIRYACADGFNVAHVRAARPQCRHLHSRSE